MFHKIASFFGKLFGSIPSWSQKASAAISYVAPLLNTILAFTAGPEYTGVVSNIVAQVQSDLALAAAVISEAHGAGGAPAGLSGTLQSIIDNLNGLLTAGHIKDPNLVAKVTILVNLIAGELQAVLTSIPKPAVTVTTGIAAAGLLAVPGNGTTAQVTDAPQASNANNAPDPVLNSGG